jgi:hypothetical protein
MAARSSQDVACCLRATGSARSKYASAFAASGSGDISTICPAVRWTSASHHRSLVVFTAAIASPTPGQASSNCSNSACPLPNMTNAMASTILISSTTQRSPKLLPVWPLSVAREGQYPISNHHHLPHHGALFVRERDKFVEFRLYYRVAPIMQMGSFSGGNAPPPPALLDRPFVLGVALPSAASTPR